MSYEVVATGLKFPEGPIWMPDGSIVLVEIAAGRLSRVQPDGSVETVSELGGGPNGAAIGPDGKCYVCNSGGFSWIEVDGLLYPEGTPDSYAGGRIERVDLETGEFDTVYTECEGNALSGPNDIVFDSEGGFWFTDTGKLFRRTTTRGGLYYAKTDGSHIEEVIYPLEFPNGVALSPEEDRVYFCETLNGRLWQYPLDGVGQLAADTIPGSPDNLHHAPGGIRGFDSMAVDGAGNVCQATVFEGGISVVSPEGELVEFISLPDPLVTNICFGGDDLPTAYITMSGTGQLIKMSWPYGGHRLNY
jgi:gluconolactonase